MKLRILAVGHKMPDWVEQACTEYLKRMPREVSVEIVEIKPDRRAAGKNAEQVQAAEAARILAAAAQDLLVVLDEQGHEVGSTELASRMQGWRTSGRNVALVIGGADGLHSTLKQQADWRWSLSRLTLPHGMVRIVLSEQLYRAWTIISHHPYHRA